jgi:hypothetical protein
MVTHWSKSSLLKRDHSASCAILSKFWANLFCQIDRAMCQLQFVLLKSQFGGLQREESRGGQCGVYPWTVISCGVSVIEFVRVCVIVHVMECVMGCVSV